MQQQDIYHQHAYISRLKSLIKLNARIAYSIICLPEKYLKAFTKQHAPPRILYYKVTSHFLNDWVIFQYVFHKCMIEIECQFSQCFKYRVYLHNNTRFRAYFGIFPKWATLIHVEQKMFLRRPLVAKSLRQNRIVTTTQLVVHSIKRRIAS